MGYSAGVVVTTEVVVVVMPDEKMLNDDYFQAKSLVEIFLMIQQVDMALPASSFFAFVFL